MDEPTTHAVRLDAQAVAVARSQVVGLGALGEGLAASHLTVDDHLSVVARNWRVADENLRGEIDLIALDEATGTLVVCEVKTRRDAERFGGALAAVGPRKRARIRALTGAFLRESASVFRRVRLDVVAIDLAPSPRLTHVEDAL